MPDPGSKSVILNGGEYELISRIGDVTVIAMVGSASSVPGGSDISLNVTTLGFHPFLNVQPGSGAACEQTSECPGAEECYDFGPEFGFFCTRIYEGIDIVVDTPLAKEMEVIYDEPLLGVASSACYPAPDRTLLNITYDFDYMGTWTLTSVETSLTDRMLMLMPYQLPVELDWVNFNVTAGYAGEGNPLCRTTISLTTDRRNVTPDELELTEIMRVPREVHPGAGEPMATVGTGLYPNAGKKGGAFEFHFIMEPGDGTAPYLPNIFEHQIYQQEVRDLCITPLGIPYSKKFNIPGWRIITGPTTNDFQLPMFPKNVRDARLPQGSNVWDMYGVISGVDFDNLAFGGTNFWSSITHRGSRFLLFYACEDLTDDESECLDP
jgi:hypothetical protein